MWVVRVLLLVFSRTRQGPFVGSFTPPPSMLSSISISTPFTNSHLPSFPHSACVHKKQPRAQLGFRCCSHKVYNYHGPKSFGFINFRGLSSVPLPPFFCVVRATSAFRYDMGGVVDVEDEQTINNITLHEN